METKGTVAISIVIPVFNGAPYLEQTIQSLLEQTFTNFEIVCVNDSSTDNSLDILNRLSKLDSRIKVYTKTNGGTAAKAINYGLQYSSGDYFMYSSQDDLYSVNLLEDGYSKAQSLNADAVIPNLIYYYNDKDLGQDSVENTANDIEYSGREAFLLSLDWRIHGFVLWSMKTVRKVGFSEFGLNSDEYTTRMLFFHSNKVVFGNGSFYYRQNNPNAITKRWNIGLLDYVATNKRIEKFLIENHFSNIHILKIYKAILHDLIRIKMIYDLNKKNLNINDRKIANNRIKDIFNSERRNFSKLDKGTLLNSVKFLVQSTNYTTFSIYCRLTQIYNSVINIKNGR